MLIGCHLTIARGYKKAAELALDIGANVFQFFSRNPRGSSNRELDLEDVEGMREILRKHDFGPLLAHAPYIINLASHKDKTYGMAKRILKEDYKRANEISIPYFNFHPGNHVGMGVEYGIQRIIDALNEIITGNETTMILLETMSGKGTEIGRNFQELKAIIGGVKYDELVGVCLDTCHVYSAGYDIVGDLDGVLEEFDEIVGLERLKAIHLNDSMIEFDSNKDRHARLGEGTIGLDAIKNIINHPLLKDLPFYLETPNELEGYKKEIELLKELRD
ncbi:deoxyribonuclease IV [Tepidimicrobium xylanilyticum]|uniref:Probable endonuclease 4 n=1 Tax=Tepidimicrobium xylanilyticum TaxID=1123352 RepID=A0A1H2Z5P8_9FIRM|nr:deoxyribonuclease IV [Tepidimicrobium xylanilyticum]GMG96389.1 putative endonuclease 4 [Tepidimicrobium xylanilyticum]SDX12657.1 Endonuclease IV [Tepidimicrobium xylanilyticum]